MIGDKREVEIPGLVRIKPGAIDRLGIYLNRAEFRRVALLHSEGLPETIIERARVAMAAEALSLTHVVSVKAGTSEAVSSLLQTLSTQLDCIVGLGGGRALDVAKLVATRHGAAMFSLPTSLSNDGFASPQSSLTVQGQRRSFPASMPRGVIVDTAVCLNAPRLLWLSGVGDLVAKLTAVRDWKLAFHHDGTPVDDFAALLSDASVFQFMGRPLRDLEGIRLLATALMLNGISMAICGSSRPASGSEHLISHALDSISRKPRLHGLQVGVATYMLSQLHEHGTREIHDLFEATGFWPAIQAAPFSLREWKEAIQIAPNMKSNFHTILSVEGQQTRLIEIMGSDPVLESCFRE